MKNDPIREYARLMRNIENAALCIQEHASNHGDTDPDKITWADVGSAAKVYEDLKEISRFIGIEVKEVC